MEKKRVQLGGMGRKKVDGGKKTRKGSEGRRENEEEGIHRGKESLPENTMFKKVCFLTQ